MQITLNGNQQELAEGLNILQLLLLLNLSDQRLAVEVNLQIISANKHSQYILQANDKVEIVHAIGGG